MFKIKDNRILVNRGDAGTMVIARPEIDANGYAKYKDSSENIYWYDKTDEILYDNNYNESSVNINSLTVVLQPFSDGDVIRLGVYGENELDSAPYINKEITVVGEQMYVNIPLTSEDTKIGDYINDKTKYWWEVELNGEQTLIGYDEDGPKIFMLYPEGVVINE